MKQNKFIPN